MKLVKFILCASHLIIENIQVTDNSKGTTNDYYNSNSSSSNIQSSTCHNVKGKVGSDSFI